MFKNNSQYHIILLLLFGLSSRKMQAQLKQDSSKSNIIVKFIKPSSDSLFLDSFSISPNSFKIIELDTSDYFFDPINSILLLKQGKEIQQDSLQVEYRRLPLRLNKSYFHKDPNIIQKNVMLRGNTYTYDAKMAGQSKGQFIDFNQLDYSGNYGRSLSVGNSQDVVLNSQFNLQLKGYLLDSIKIDAAITDNNVPFQPEGNTQRLQEFDKIFITFSKRMQQLTLGDFTMEQPKSYFLRYNKRVQGLQYMGVIGEKSRVKNKVGLSASMAKGQFSRNIFQGIEGNQGPYKLKGENGEQYFIVLAGSEKVYIDGELLERGEDRDYIINYNIGEITFMPSRLITKDKRIQVEFEYQSRNYLNSLVQLSDQVNIGKKLELNFNFYNNQDAKNRQYTQNLSDAQKQFLAGIGDNIDQAFYSSANLDTFASNKILYRKIDTLVNGILYPDVYVYSTDTNQAKYSLGFSSTIDGQGNYVISNLNTNGRSYAWIAPINGIPQGNFEPRVLLITPKKLQVISAGGTYKIDSLKQFNLEWSGSEYSPNTFSKTNNDIHWGNSIRLGYQENRILKKDSLEKPILTWENEINYEFVDNRFQAISPFRNVEFSRDWNIFNPLTERSNETLIDLNSTLNSYLQKHIKYNYTYYRRGDGYQGHRQLLKGAWEKGSFRAGMTGSLLLSRAKESKSFYLRPSALLEYYTSSKKTSLFGLHYEKEYNALKENISDSLLQNAANFDITKLYFKNTGKTLVLDAGYSLRRDFRANRNNFSLANIAHTFELDGKLNKWKNHQINVNASYRILDYSKSPLLNLNNEQTLLGRINYAGNLKKGFFTPTLLYDFGTGQEQKRQFTFVEVAAGQGTHMWVDYNNDGIQQANEFELAIYPDQKLFIKIITPTNEYVKVNFANLNFNFQLAPENLWSENDEITKAQRFVSRFSDQFSLQVNNRILHNEGLKVFNPLQFNFEDTSVVTSLATMANTFYFNRSSTKWGAEYTTSLNRTQSLLTYGLEMQKVLRHHEKFRWIVNKTLTFNLNGIQGNRSFKSPITDGRTYKIEYNGIEPNFVFIYSNRIRITTSYKFENRTNQKQFGGEQANVNTFTLESKWSTPKVGNLLARASYNNIDFDGIANTPLSYVMLETLSNGNNWLWHLNWTTRLSKTIEFSVEYDGRKVGKGTGTTNQKVIHTGSMSLRAVL